VHITRCPHDSGEAPCSFTMAPCVVVERLEGKQQCGRAPVGEHAEVQAQDAECGCHEQQEVNEKRPKPRNSPLYNHDSTADNICSSILVRGRSIRSMARSGRQPRRPLPRKDSHFRHFGGLSRVCMEKVFLKKEREGGRERVVLNLYLYFYTKFSACSWCVHV